MQVGEPIPLENGADQQGLLARIGSWIASAARRIRSAAEEALPADRPEAPAGDEGGSVRPEG